MFDITPAVYEWIMNAPLNVQIGLAVGDIILIIMGSWLEAEFHWFETLKGFFKKKFKELKTRKEGA